MRLDRDSRIKEGNSGERKSSSGHTFSLITAEMDKLCSWGILKDLVLKSLKYFSAVHTNVHYKIVLYPIAG